MKTTTPDPGARRASRRVRFADEKGEREDDSWIVDDDSESTTTATRARSSANESVECVERVESVSRVPSPTTTPRAEVGESTSSAVKDRVAAFERAASDVDEESRVARASTRRTRAWSSTPPAPRFEVGTEERMREEAGRTPTRAPTSAATSAASASRAIERVAEDVRAVRAKLFESSVEAIGALDAEAGSWEASARERRNASARTSVDDEDADSRDRASRVMRRAEGDFERLRRTHDAREARVVERRGRWMETERAARRFGGGAARRRPTSSASVGPVFLTGVPASSSKHANYVDERASRASDDGESLLKLAAFTALRNHAERNRAATEAANDLGMIRRAPVLRRAFEGLRSHAVACAPRTRAMLEACETFAAATNRRVRRETLRQWRRAAKESSLERTCAAIHNVRCAHAALCHWELFAARAFWKRRARELANRYADGRLKISAFFGWLRHARRANERRIAVRARMFGMSALEAKRAIHQQRDRTAADAHEAMELAARDLFETACLRSALRAQVSTSATLVRTLSDARRFTATDDDVTWASMPSARVRGVGKMRRHKAAGFDARVVDETRRDALARERDDVVASRTAATIEEEEESTSRAEMTTFDVDALRADAYEAALEHQKSLRDAREATRQCVDARGALHETTVAASRVTANADARANAAMQGARDAVEDADKAERLVIEAERAADAAETRADALAARGARRDDDDVTEAFGLAADAATRAVTLSSAHVAAARVAERATRIAEEHAAARELVGTRAAEDVEEARERVRDAEALVLTTAKIERELKARALDASRLLRRVEGPSASVACDDRNVFVRRERDDVVFSPTKARSADEKRDARRRVTWESFGDGDDDDDDDVRDALIDTRGMSLRPGEWRTLAQCAAQAHGKRLAMKTFRGFASHVIWRRRQREARQLAFVTDVFTSWARHAHANQTRRKLVERAVDEVVRADRARRLGAYVACFRVHAKWRRARSEELAISLRRVVEPTITRPAFEHWRRKVSNIFLARRVVSAAVDAWRRRLAKPAYASDFYCCWDSFHAWRSLARERRDARRRRQTAVEYHRVSLALKTLRVLRRAARRRRDRHHRLHRLLHHRRLERERRLARHVLVAWRVEARRRRRLARCVETRLRRLARDVFSAWRASARAAVITRTARPSPIRDVRDHFPVRGVPWRPCSPATRVR